MKKISLCGEFHIRILFFLTVIFISTFVYGADPVDELVTRFIEKTRTPGVALLVIQNGQVIKSQGYGYSNLEHEVPVKPETIFQSGSVAKQFAATAVMILLEEGKIGLDDAVGKYIDEAPKEWDRITIRHLLTHTSGLGDYPDNFDFRKDYTETDILKIIVKQPLLFQPGEKYTYSNLAYVLLGIIIRKASGQFYGDFLQERVFRPLGMTTTRVISEEDIVPNRAAGYRLVDGKIKNQEWVAPTVNTTADGSLYFSIVDLAKWDAALSGERILKRSSLDQMWTPVKLNNGKTYPYGFGWRLGNVRGHRIVEHGGAWQGFQTHISRYVDDRLTVVVLTNFDRADATYLAHAVAGVYNEAVGPPKHTAVEVNQNVLEQYAGEYRWVSGETIRIHPDSNKLIGTIGKTKYELIPESETSFFLEFSATVIVFERNKKGEPTVLIWRSDDEDERAMKIK